MIEVMIALAVFSVALIALVALQLNAYSSSQSAGYRRIAVNYANDLFEKMRANSQAAQSGFYFSTSGQNNNCRSYNFNTVNSPQSCTSQQMAQDDLMEFFSQVAATLPQGQAVICKDSSEAQGTPSSPNCNGQGSEYVVKIFWKDSSSQTLGTNSGWSQVIIGGQL